MIRWLAALLIALAAPAAAADPTNEVTITRAGDRWTAELSFARDAPVWMFTRSNVTRIEKRSWRTPSITVLTPGVSLQRLGLFDALVAAKGNVPRRVRLRFTPAPVDLLADYDPALVFSDGSVALFTGHWELFPQPSLQAARALGRGGERVDPGDVAPPRLTFRYPGGRILYDGSRRPEQRLDNSETYVLFGDAEAVEGAAISTIIDPKTPAWLAAEIKRFTPRLLDEYAGKLGPRAGAKPMAMVSWAGPTKNLRSLGGSVLPGMVLVRLEGDALVKPDPPTLTAARWFIAHEAAHFWLGQTVRYGGPEDAWITEGGADLLAIRAVGAIDPAFDQRRELQRRLDQCVTLAPKGGIASAGARNDQDVYYGCGAMFALAAEALARMHGGDAFSFYRGLIEANRNDGVLDRADWLGAFTRLAGSDKPAEIVAAMLDKATADAAPQLAALFDATGVRYQRSAAGGLLLP